MIEKFLKAKHWQIFLLTVGFQALLQVKLIPFIVSLNNTKITLYVIPILILLSLSGFYLYFWTVTIGLHKELSDGLKLKIIGFKIKFFYLLFHLIGFSIIGVISFLGLFNNYFANRGGFIFGPQMIFIPIHLFAIYCFFSLLYTISKAIGRLKHNDRVSFSKNIGNFLLMCLFPIGIWIIQPTINKLIKKKE